MLDDDQLLERLGAALRPMDALPDGTEIAALQRAVAQRRHQRPAAQVGFWTGFRRGFHRPLVVLLVGITALSGGTALALGSGATLPRPLRSAAQALGLPVDSVALSETRATMAKLDAALDAGDAAAVRTQAAALRADLTGLSDADRAEAQPEARVLLARAATFLDDANTTDDATDGSDDQLGDAGGGDDGTPGGTTGPSVDDEGSGATSGTGGSNSGSGAVSGTGGSSGPRGSDDDGGTGDDGSGDDGSGDDGDDDGVDNSGSGGSDDDGDDGDDDGVDSGGSDGSDDDADDGVDNSGSDDGGESASDTFGDSDTSGG